MFLLVADLACGSGKADSSVHAEMRPARASFSSVGAFGRDRRHLKRSHAMTCPKCATGFMVPIQLVDWADETGATGVPAWRCANCGTVIDPVIERNRMVSACVREARVAFSRKVAA